MSPMNINPRLYASEPMRRCRLNECKGACCLYGVWLDVKEASNLLNNAALISPHMPPAYQDPLTWFDERQDEDEFSPSKKVIHSSVIEDSSHYGGTACVFLRSDYKCALQVAADALGAHPWNFKPFYCILHPLDLDENGAITLDETELMLDEPGSCLRPDPTLTPLAEIFEPELTYLLGKKAQQTILAEARLRLKQNDRDQE
jgi:hypothetical protein